MQLLDNLAKQTSSPSHRSITQGTLLIVKVPGSESGYLEGTVYLGNTPDAPIEWSGLGIHTHDSNTDGMIEIPLILPFGDSSPIPKGQYYLKVQAADKKDSIPQWWNIDFDIV